MRNRLYVAAWSAAALGLLGGCSQSKPVGGAPEPSYSVDGGESARWHANIQSVTQSRGDIGQSTRDRSYGTAVWTQGSSATLSAIELVFNFTGQERSLAWAILPGACGTHTLPVIPLSNFPELPVGGGGRAQVTSSLPIELPAGGSYHIDIYRDRRGSADAIIACGNFRHVGG